MSSSIFKLKFGAKGLGPPSEEEVGRMRALFVDTLGMHPIDADELLDRLVEETGFPPEGTAAVLATNPEMIHTTKMLASILTLIRNEFERRGTPLTRDEIRRKRGEVERALFPENFMPRDVLH